MKKEAVKAANNQIFATPAQTQKNKSSAVAEMATQCCTSRICVSRFEVPLFNTHSLSNRYEYHSKSIYCRKVGSLDYIFVVESFGLTSPLVT